MIRFVELAQSKYHHERVNRDGFRERGTEEHRHEQFSGWLRIATDWLHRLANDSADGESGANAADGHS